MCCLFTCCGWMVDLIQRFWTFTMSCCISSAICCMLITASMSGVALGYNYSLAEYMDLKETNVSVFMKRGVFDDEMSDVEFRRSGDVSEKSLQNAALEETTTVLRSGRRLDDSVFETGDQHRYEGNLIRLTAKPAYVSTPLPRITDDLEMANIATSYEKNSLDSLKAIQGLIDARRSMANRLTGGTTLSPVPTYPFHEAERVYHNAGGRRVMPNIDYKAHPGINPARLAVPSPNIGARVSWQAPKNPEAFRKIMKDYGLEHEPITYPSPIPFNTGPIRPTLTSSTAGRDAIFLTKTEPFPFFSSGATNAPEISKPPDVESFKEKLLLENEMAPRKKSQIKFDEEYDYDVKGLPVRKRRNVELNMAMNNNKLNGVDNKELDIMNDNYKVTNEYLFSFNTNRIVKKETAYVDQQGNNRLNWHEKSKDIKIENKILPPRTPKINETDHSNNIKNYLLAKLKSIKKILLESVENGDLFSEGTNKISNRNEITSNVNATKILPNQVDKDTKVTVKFSKKKSNFVNTSNYNKSIAEISSEPFLVSLLFKK